MPAYLGAMRHYATFSGRTSRSEFWQAHIVLLPLMLLAFGVFGVPFTGEAGLGGSRSVWPMLFFVLIVAPHIVPWAALTVRRLHDMGFSGWWALIALVPVIPIVPLGIVVLLAWACVRGTPGPNQFGPTTVRAVNASETGAESSADVATARRGDLIAEMERLARLKETGVLTEAEFVALKAWALGQGKMG